MLHSFAPRSSRYVSCAVWCRQEFGRSALFFSHHAYEIYIAVADVFTRKCRSAIMRRVRSTRNASTEQRLMILLHAHRLRGWRRSVRLTGSPDFVWRKQRVALFVDGCFWHGCPKHGHVPRSRLEYWIPKLQRNKRRDRAVTKMLREHGWVVVRIWECQLTHRHSLRVAANIKRVLEARA